MSTPELPLPPAYPDRAAWGTATKLRAWQQAALSAYFERNPKDFLAVATPGAGKTTFALTVASELLSRRVVDPIVEPPLYPALICCALLSVIREVNTKKFYIDCNHNHGQVD